MEEETEFEKLVRENITGERKAAHDTYTGALCEELRQARQAERERSDLPHIPLADSPQKGWVTAHLEARIPFSGYDSEGPRYGRMSPEDQVELTEINRLHMLVRLHLE